MGRMIANSTSLAKLRAMFLTLRRKLPFRRLITITHGLITAVAAERGTDNASTFDASTDEVTTDAASRTASQADVSALATQTSVDSIDTDIQNIGSDVSAILTDTNELQLNQGNWLTATGFSTHSAADVATAVLVTPANKLATDASGNVEANNMRGTDGANTVAPDNTSITAILADTNELQLNQGDWATATGFSTHNADVATAVLVTPANKLATDASGNVEANNMRGTDGANTVAPDNTSISAILADTNELQLNQGNWLTATGFSTHSEPDVATAVLVTPANKLATDLSGNVEANNMRELTLHCSPLMSLLGSLI